MNPTGADASGAVASGSAPAGAIASEALAAESIGSGGAASGAAAWDEAVSGATVSEVSVSGAAAPDQLKISDPASNTTAMTIGSELGPKLQLELGLDEVSLPERIILDHLILEYGEVLPDLPVCHLHPVDLGLDSLGLDVVGKDVLAESVSNQFILL